MKTTATNRKLRVVLSDIQNGKLVPNPDFQRRLVWSMKHKNAFLRTVLEQYPFPEIYVAAGSVNPETAEGTEMLVDGQQRITTLYQYFKSSDELRLEADVPSYAELKTDTERLRAFLEYEVVVRDLGQVSQDAIIEVFRRINSTKYSLNAVEVHNARFEGAFKNFAAQVTEFEFFEKHRIFPASAVRRMGDLRFALTLVATLLSTYFNRDDDLETFLMKYNDEFPHEDSMRQRLERAFSATDALALAESSRAWSEVNLLPLLVEVERATSAESPSLQDASRTRLQEFFSDLDSSGASAVASSPLQQYYAAQRFATADRNTRLRRGTIIRSVIEGMSRAEWLAAPRQDQQTLQF